MTSLSPIVVIVVVALIVLVVVKKDLVVEKLTALKTWLAGLIGK